MPHQKYRHSRRFAQAPESKPERAKGRRRSSPSAADRDHVQLFGLHTVEAALGNPNRAIIRLRATENATHRLGALIAKRGLQVETVLPKDLDRLLGAETVHQGVLLEAGPLPPMRLEDMDADGILLVLDQVTDPHNVGAALRSAAAFGAAGLVLTERHSPPLSGVLAKAASGALDLTPVVQVKNLAQALTELGERGVMRIGLAEDADAALEDTAVSRPLALVLGAEGKGLRQLTRERCDMICRISTVNALASLNVSNAAAIAMHWARLKT
jgi:23S rRNA (guanosine2251-2'-O)-methyltransferase